MLIYFSVALPWCYEKTFFDGCGDKMGWEGNSRKLHYDALFYYMVAIEWEKIGKHTSLAIGNELNEEALNQYDHFCHENLFPPSRRNKVTAIVCDGHQKVLMKCLGKKVSTSRSGRPRKDGVKKEEHNHGWFMVIDPCTSRILAIESLDKPENNEIVTRSVTKVLPLYPKVDLLILDRCCHYKSSAINNPELSQIKYYSLDKFHAYRHKSTCPCNPLAKKSLKKRLGSINTSVAEQTFSWFRGYANFLNDMCSLRHRFAVLLFCTWHNDLMTAGKTEHLNQFKWKKQSRKISKPYSCNLKRKGKGHRSMRVLKAMKAMK